MYGENDQNFLYEVLAELSYPMAPPSEMEHNGCAFATSTYEPMGDESGANDTGHCSEHLQGKTVNRRKRYKNTTATDHLEAESDIERARTTAGVGDENATNNNIDSVQPTKVNKLSIEEVSKH